MKIPHYLTRAPSGVWHYRQRVPTDLVAALGQQCFKRSLKTRALLVAQLRALAWSARYAAAFEHARVDPVADKKKFIDDVMAKAIIGDLKHYTIAHTPHGLSISADGADDHARAMQALDRLGQFDPRTFAPVGEPAREVPAKAKAGLSAGKAAEAWLAFIKSDTKPKTHIIKTAAVMGFVRHYGEREPLAAVSRMDVGAWVDALKAGGLETPTLVNKCSYLKGFFEWGMGKGHYPTGDNPAQGQVEYGKAEKRRRRGLGFKAFEPEQVRALYAPDALAKANSQTRWGAIIGLYTGARVSEVGQLALTDFCEEDGIPCLKITDEGEGQSTKNDPSIRTIPLHPDLIALGLLERVQRLRAEGEERLFPGLKVGSINGMGDWLSKAFGRYLQAQGVKKPAKGKVGFHSLRKTAVQTMKKAKVPLEWRAAYVGHDLDEEHIEAYSGEYRPGDILEAVGKGLSWGLDIKGLKAILG